MPTVRIPLVGSFNQRGLDGNATLTLSEDQRFLNCAFNIVQNPVTGKSAVHVEKRPGWGTDSIPETGSASTGMIKPQVFNAAVSAFGETNSNIYVGSNSVGTITGRAMFFTETLISSVSHVMIKSSDGTGWYYPNGAKDITAYTCDGNNSTTITDIKVSGASSVSGLYIGQKLSAATNIAAGSRIVSINAGAFTAVLDTATTGGVFNDLATTKEPVAKLLDTDFITTGSYISAFSEMDGYLFYTTDDGNIRNSDLNSVTAYTSTSFIQPNMAPDPPIGIARQKNAIIAFGTGSKEVFYNAGNATGSPLQRSAQFFERIGGLHQRSITTLENDIFFVSTPRYGDIGVYRIRELASQKISTANIDRIIGNMATGGTIYASSFRLGGYPYASFAIILASDTSDKLLLESGDYLLLESADKMLLEGNAAQTASFVRQLVYNAQLGIWGEWDSDEATFIDGGGAGTSNQIFATSRVTTTGKVYTINPIAAGELFTDNGSAYTMQIRTARLDMGTSKRKFVPRIVLICDKQAAGTATLEASDDDYATWRTIGTFDLTKMNPEIDRCGSYQGGRAYRISHSYNGPFRAEALEIDYSIGTA